MKQEDRPQRNDSDLTSERPLQSWKEIACHLERDERTARRWEKNAALPVRRHGEGKGSSVYAYPSEIEAWRTARQPQSDELLEKKHQRRRNMAVFAAVLTVLFAAWFLTYSPILNPPNPLVEADGVTMRQVWSGSESDSSGTPSPDGRYLSYVDWKTGDLALRDLVTEENRRLTNKGTWAESREFALEAVFSPDGGQIAYTWFNKDLVSDLRLVKVDGSIPRVLFGGDAVDYVRPVGWMPDGSQVLVVVWQKDRTAQIGLVSIREGTLRVLKTLDRCFPFQISLSPDGRYAVYDVPLWGESTSGDVFLLATETSLEIPLVQHPAQDLYPVWTPDGKAVVFASDRTGTLGLWNVQVADGKPRGSPQLVKADIGRFSPMGFTRTGAFFYRVDTGMIDVHHVKLDLKAGKVLEGPTRFTERYVGSNYCPDLSSDGKYLSYLSRRSPIPNLQVGAGIVIRTLASGEEREISPELSTFILPYWSPDGKYFLTSGQDWQGNSGVFKIDAKAGDTFPIVVAEEGMRIGGPAIWSRDGTSVVYIQVSNENRRTLQLRDLESGCERELVWVSSPESLGNQGFSRDGKRLAYVLRNRETDVQTICVMPVAGGESRKLVQFQKPEYLINATSLEWTLDDKEILIVRKTDGEPDDRFELMAVSVDDGKLRELGLAPQHETVFDLRLHPSGDSLVFTMGERRETEVWVMEGFLAGQ